VGGTVRYFSVGNPGVPEDVGGEPDFINALHVSMGFEYQ